MDKTRYREERTFVRGICRLPEEDKEAYKQKVSKLHDHFTKFNVDVSELCQWIMGFRPNNGKKDQRITLFWEFYLTPEKFINGNGNEDPDQLRLQIFDIIAGWGKESDIAETPISPELLEVLPLVSAEKKSQTAERLFERLKEFKKSHRMILLKSSAEWVYARYQRLFENYEKQHEEWEKEKKQWEDEHPELTAEIREKYNDIFKKLEVKKKTPRICKWECLKQNIDNCNFEGELLNGKKHSQLCKKYFDFTKSYKPLKGKRNKKRAKFREIAEKYLDFRRKYEKRDSFNRLLNEDRKFLWFGSAWDEYLKALNINEETILKDYGGKIPHCTIFAKDKDCEFNKHTEKCNQYKIELDNLSKSELELESLYREWRKDFVWGPGKPIFRYPSGKKLQTPKIFGKDYFEIDFDKSVLSLRLDNKGEDEWLNFGFMPWPKNYDKQPADIKDKISSVNINFIGNKPRAGFRFKVPHKKSRFRISQDEIDYLRSRKYPRKSQDQKFLDEARQLLLKNFSGNPEKEMRIMAVDLGTGSAAAAIFEGKVKKSAMSLKVIKSDKLRTNTKNGKKGKDPRGRGVSLEHIQWHIKARNEGMKKIQEKIKKYEEKQKLKSPADSKETKEKIKKDKKNEEFKFPAKSMGRLDRHIRLMLRDWVRLNAKQIIKTAEENNVDLIIFESLRGSKIPGYDDLNIEEKGRKVFWSYGKIRHKVREKAVERGMLVATVPEYNSSHICSECGNENWKKWRKNKKKKLFICANKHCSLSKGGGIDSDENAAIVIGKIFWGEIKASPKSKKNKKST